MDDLQRFAQSYLDGLTTSDEFVRNVVNHLSYFVDDTEKAQAFALALAKTLTGDN